MIVDNNSPLVTRTANHSTALDQVVNVLTNEGTTIRLQMRPRASLTSRTKINMSIIRPALNSPALFYPV